VSSTTSSGTNDLIKQGAKLVTEPQEILSELKDNLFLGGYEHAQGPQEKLKGICSPRFNPDELSVIEKLSDEPKYVDHISQETGLTISEIMSILVQLELKGVIKQLPGKNFVINAS